MLRTAVATCLLHSASVTGDEYQDGYAEYDEHPFSLPCGTHHTGSDTSEVSEWRRVRPDFEEVSGRLYNYKWAEWQVPCLVPDDGVEVSDDGSEGCLWTFADDQDSIDALGASDWASLPMESPYSYFTGLGMRGVWLLVQAVVSLFAAVISCCCIMGAKPKKLKKLTELIEKGEGVGEPSKNAQYVAKFVLGVGLLLTLFMASSLEYGNLIFNTSVHHAIHSVEGILAYADDCMEVVELLAGVGDNVVAQISIVNGTIFDNANPVELAELAACLDVISTGCTGASLVTPTPTEPNIPPYFEVPNTRVYPPGYPGGLEGVEDPRQSCDTSLYIEDVDYMAIAAPLADMCVAHCLAMEAGCTGCQWTSADNSGCVLWFGNKCSTLGSDAGSISDNDAMMLYQRASPAVPTVDDTQSQCVANTITVLANINDNVLNFDENLDMQYEGTPIIELLSNLHTNEVNLCDIGEGAMATGMATALAEMPNALTPAQSALSGFKDAMVNVSSDLRTVIQDYNEYRHILTDGDPDLPDAHSVYLSEDGSVYPDGKTCTSLRCFDNTFDQIDSGEAWTADGPGTGHDRTLLFTNIMAIANLGAVLGIAALVFNSSTLWKLCCFLFLLWGPVSLLVAAPIMPAFMMISDFCQDIEDVAIEVIVASMEGGTNGYTILNGTESTETLQNTDGMNFTGSIPDLQVQHLESALEYYLKGCQSGTGLDAELEEFKLIAVNASAGLSETATSVINSMSEAMPSGMVLDADLLNNVTQVINVAIDDETGIPHVISEAITLIQCPRVSQMYFELKSPICCDVVVAIFWIIYPLSWMAFGTCLPMCLSCCLGKRAFHKRLPKDQVEKSQENKFYDNPIMEDDNEAAVMKTSNPVTATATAVAVPVNESTAET